MKRGFASTITRVSVCTIALILSAVIVATPSRAYASDGFLGGLQDLVGVREVEETSFEQEYLDEYEGGLRANPSDPGTNTLTDLGEDATTVDYVNSTLDSFNSVSYKSYNSSPTANQLTLFDMTRTLIGAGGNTLGQNMRAQMVLIAAGLVFMWWGVRKTIKMVMSGFRKGSMNV